MGVVALLDEAQRLGILGKVSDEDDFWETRSLERLTKEIGDQSAMLAGFLGMLKDAMGQTPGGAGTVEAPNARGGRDAFPQSKTVWPSTSSISSTAAILSFANRGLGGKTDICDMGLAAACQNAMAVTPD